MIKVPIGVPVARPKIGSAGKTGLWRVEKPVISYDKCTKCRLCVLYCLENTIDLLENLYPQIDYDYCKGCGVCAQVCPPKAIDMVREVK
ncbi:4Fe-4S dicluster domain-containing protein [Saccharolobus solfataricus]|uniref:Pyruvate synthase delta chain (Pyruvic-ferredoxin oxidoreductase delta chain) (PorD-1) n=3 Tax=Saccharolobus solfataricus TaxID=2287 RepID=Q97YU8_SACS2|nr:4Fe-4S binding protein [Saccharolobus solfataricus]AAK41455.1 Pyruvate synthase delta chain (Pyruvic-ferredoxin oxidoreductase delta chain) (porD-1) [Saccharolobus solfataricus P2]AKA74389.1 4Fe-4S dicluster domain-containing protein [Saccharolobus solfataricus]AKA77084.1 4Fe-4S dicluster domain-containing protein [Saccharolobus solfataricus]AKA79777.1 4Fe-4S dicluster domain-containing protein [Saccharolobus solfataricus]AZF68869.1 4Fe-4S dicluster domain-containing protein [Saccharolobus 